MSAFFKYPSILNKVDDFVEAVDAADAETECIATAKIHGSNVAVHVDVTTGEVRYARRNAFLDPDEPHFGVRAATASCQWAALARAAEAAEAVGVPAPADSALSTVVVFGEVYGGRYPHPTVEKSLRARASEAAQADATGAGDGDGDGVADGAPATAEPTAAERPAGGAGGAAAASVAVAPARPVQLRVWYCPDIRFRAFDVCFVFANGERRWLDTGAARRLCEAHAIPFVVEVFRGKVREVIAWAREHANDPVILMDEFEVPSGAGADPGGDGDGDGDGDGAAPAARKAALPPIEGNVGEGFVVRSATEMRWGRGRAIVKVKGDAFAEVAYKAADPEAARRRKEANAAKRAEANKKAEAAEAAAVRALMEKEKGTAASGASGGGAGSDGDRTASGAAGDDAAAADADAAGAELRADTHPAQLITLARVEAVMSKERADESSVKALATLVVLDAVKDLGDLPIPVLCASPACAAAVIDEASPQRAAMTSAAGKKVAEALRARGITPSK